MSWFAASIVTVVKFRDGAQNCYPVFETTYLVEANDFNQAELKANKLGELEAMAGDDLTYEGRPAFREFLGVRKLKLTHSLAADDGLGSVQPMDGTEISESYFEAANEADCVALAKGKRVTVSYVDDDD
jgi:hypothetical protein